MNAVGVYRTVTLSLHTDRKLNVQSLPVWLLAPTGKSRMLFLTGPAIPEHEGCKYPLIDVSFAAYQCNQEYSSCRISLRLPIPLDNSPSLISRGSDRAFITIHGKKQRADPSVIRTLLVLSECHQETPCAHLQRELTHQ